MMNDIANELAKLQVLHGADFVKQLKTIVDYSGFNSVDGEKCIYAMGGESNEYFEFLLNAARKAVSHGYKVYILPNPKGFRSADYIFVRKGTYKLYDLKTIIGKSSVGNRLDESIGQSNRILLNVVSNYNPRLLALDIKRYFERNDNAIEVLIFRGGKTLSVIREDTEAYGFIRNFIMKCKI